MNLVKMQNTENYTQKKVFISGSSSVTLLPQEAKERLKAIINKGIMILVGDCRGVDTLIQEFCKEMNYQNVLVYYVGGSPRNNLGFQSYQVQTSNLLGRAFYTAKDIEMAKSADYGLVIWDKKSVGTGRNIQQLKDAKKYVVVVETQSEEPKASENTDLDYDFDQIQMFQALDSEFYSKNEPLHKISPLNFEDLLALEYKYKALPKDKSKDMRRIYLDHIPENLSISGGEKSLYSKNGTLISSGYERIVIGDYGAFVEFSMDTSNSNEFSVKNGQEYRILDPKYANNVKYFWYTVDDDSDVKIYLQARRVTYADYKPWHYYVSVFEVFS